MAVAFDLASLGPRGSPVPILDDVYTHPYDLAYFTVSAAGVLAYVPGRHQSTMAWVDREGRSTPVRTEPGELNWPRLSPDGTRVALARSTERTQYEIWVYGLKRGTSNRLTVGGGNTRPFWTPDGARVTFASASSERLYRALADGSGEAELLLTGVAASDVRFVPRSASPDGQLLVGVKRGRAGLDLWALRIGRDLSPVVVSPFNEMYPEFSPDGRWLAYVSDMSGRDEVYVRPYPGPGETQMISTVGGWNPVWSPDGGELFYQDPGGRSVMATSFTAEPEVRVGRPALLFEGDYHSSGFDIPPTASAS